MALAWNSSAAATCSQAPAAGSAAAKPGTRGPPKNTKEITPLVRIKWLHSGSVVLRWRCVVLAVSDSAARSALGADDNTGTKPSTRSTNTDSDTGLENANHCQGQPPWAAKMSSERKLPESNTAHAMATKTGV